MSAIDNFLSRFGNNETKKEVVPIGKTVVNFGKFKGKTYDEIYSLDKDYTKWVITTENNPYLLRMKNYFLTRIEKDYS